MITVDIFLNNFRAKNVETFEILKGESAVLEASTGDQAVEWFSNNDPVLALNADAKSPEGRALVNLAAQREGSCKIQIQRDGQILKTLNVTVFAVEADRLNPKASEPVLR